ncbi:MAG: copper amine oxidase N-terminal domain-containing protein [Clostridia bacterium]|nr:copper amine oxidase N-terminal domain-containing protein [Clostridia bacterium]
MRRKMLSIVMVLSLCLTMIPAQVFGAADSAISAAVCGNTVQWTDAAPFIENGRTLVPLRAIAEALSLDVTWDAAAKEAVFTDGAKTIYFPIGASYARTSEGGNVTMDTSAIIRDSRTYAPVRYLAEFFGYNVGWDNATRTVIIETEADSSQAQHTYTDSELCSLAKEYYRVHNGSTPPIVEVDHTDGNMVTIHLYEEMSDHTATWDWYTVDRTTGKGKSFTSEAVDLTTVQGK